MMMKSNMCVPVEFLAGTDIKQAIREAKEKAQLWNVAYVTFDFNGTSFSIGQNADILHVVSKYHEKCDQPQHGICAS
jgi:nitrogenase molybdenum-iron protein alpha/beta subunit